MDAKSIIHALGGTTAVARSLGINRSTVSMWLSAGIPARHWLTLYRLAAASENPAARDVTLTVIEHHVVAQRASEPAEAA